MDQLSFGRQMGASHTALGKAIGDEFDYVLVSPQNALAMMSWNKPTSKSGLVNCLITLSDLTANRHRSRRAHRSEHGGYGSWRLAADHPQRFFGYRAEVCVAAILKRMR